MQVKDLVFEKRPFSSVHSILTSQGFRLVEVGESVTYRAALRDSSTQSTYWLEVPVDEFQLDPNRAKIGKPFLYGEKGIPWSVREAAESKLRDIADYLKSKIAKKETIQLNHHRYNSSMAQNVEEMKKLGKEMESMQTYAELHENGQVSDPIIDRAET